MLNNQEFCLINGGITTPYVKLKKWTRRGDAISAYLFFLVLEAVFCVIKSKKNIKDLNIFSHDSFCTAYADDTITEIASIDTLKGVNVALCGMKCLNLTQKTVKILGVHFSYNKNVEHEMNFQSHIARIKSILRVWRMRNLPIEGKVLVFKSLAISKIAHLSHITRIPHTMINQLNNIKETLYGTEKPQK